MKIQYRTKPTLEIDPVDGLPKTSIKIILSVKKHHVLDWGSKASYSNSNMCEQIASLEFHKKMRPIAQTGRMYFFADRKPDFISLESKDGFMATVTVNI